MKKMLLKDSLLLSSLDEIKFHHQFVLNVKRVLFTLSLFLLSFSTSFADWSQDSTVNNPVVVKSGDQYRPKIASDGAGGAIIVWYDYDYNNSYYYDVRAQRLNASGDTMWKAEGIKVCFANSSYKYNPEIISDGAGGAIISWVDERYVNNYYEQGIYAQRINNNGVIQWDSNGVKMSVSQNYAYNVRMATDGAGGALLTWYGYDNNYYNYQIYLQKVNGSGTTQWTSGGIQVNNNSYNSYESDVVSDGNGGALVSWTDYNYNNNYYYQVYAQKYNSSGTAQWTSGGVQLSSNNNYYSYRSRIASDDAGGAIITWYSQDNYYGYSVIKAQRVASSGSVSWTSGGVSLSNNTSYYSYLPEIIKDGSGGAMITWYENNNNGSHVMLQRVNSSGAAQWTSGGMQLSSTSTANYEPKLISDDNGGAIVAWYTYNYNNYNNYYDVLAQRVNGSGSPLWNTGGKVVSAAYSYQYVPELTGDGNGGAIVTWYDYRNSNYDVYAQNVSADGLLGVICPKDCAIEVTPSNNTYTGGVVTNLYLGYGPQSATMAASATGGTGFTYSWSPATNLSSATAANPVFTPTAAGVYTYTVTITNSGNCATTCEVTFCVKDVRVPGKGNNSKIYLCHAPDNDASKAKTLSVSINAVASHLADHSGDKLGACDQTCGSNKRNGEANFYASEGDGLTINVSPNPSNSVFKFEIESMLETPMSIEIVDLTGKIVETANNIASHQIVSMGKDLTAGIYFANIKQGGESKTIRITKSN